MLDPLVLLGVALALLLVILAYSIAWAKAEAETHLAYLQAMRWDLDELVKAERARKAAEAEKLRFWRAVCSKPYGPSTDPAEAEEEGGDDGEKGEEAGPAEVEDPEGQRGA